MELPTIDIPPAEARKRFEQYRREVRDKHDAEDAAIAKGYKALAEGTPLIRLSEAMKLGGVRRKTYSSGRATTVPCLAIARANARFAWTNGIDRNGGLIIAGKRNHASTNRRDVMRFDNGTFEQLEGTESAGWWGYRLNALVPNIPPLLRPKFNLSNYHVLWEAEWKVAPGPPPGDPALLRHVGGDLYAVHAVWDLSPLEQAVLAGRPFPDA